MSGSLQKLLIASKSSKDMATTSNSCSW